METLKDKLKKNELTVGAWVTLGHPAIIEIMAGAGFDWFAVDLEHSMIGMREASELIRTIDLLGFPALIRVGSCDPHQIKRVMDAGAAGVIVPMVNSREEAEWAVKAVKYPPRGERGVGLARAQGYGFAFERYASSINEKSIVIAQIEHAKAIEDLENILTTEGIDGTMIGPYDLSGSIGKPGQFDDPGVVRLLETYKRISAQCGKPAGIHVVQPDPRVALGKINEGYRFIAFGVDFLFLGGACRETMRILRESPN
jgi:2-dehydro-3-deoxyglucarate aldolase